MLYAARKTVDGGTAGLCHGAWLTISMGERDSVGWFSYAIPPCVCVCVLCVVCLPDIFAYL
jgi:hypothetical protein